MDGWTEMARLRRRRLQNGDWGPPGIFVDLSFDERYGLVRSQICQTKGVSRGSGRVCCALRRRMGVEIVKEQRVEERDPDGWSRQPCTESFMLPYNNYNVREIPGEKGYAYGFVPGFLPNGYNLARELVGFLGSMGRAAVAKWSNSNGIRRTASLGTLSPSGEI